jgi:DNA-binding CsgD family transcriptional regulator
MKRRIIQPWTPSDDERLRKLAAEGRSSVTIAERMKRSPASIRNRAKTLKISLRRLEVNRRFGWGSPSQD